MIVSRWLSFLSAEKGARRPQVNGFASLEDGHHLNRFGRRSPLGDPVFHPVLELLGYFPKAPPGHRVPRRPAG
jgi:hypothetical protein